MAKRTKRIIIAIALMVVGLGIGLGAGLASGITPLVPTTYGPVGERFIIAFGTTPQTRSPDLFVAQLGSTSYESVDVYRCSGSTTHCNPGYGFGGLQKTRWRGLPASIADAACHEGDSAIPCPGRVATLWVRDGEDEFQISASQVSDGEVHRFFDSFRPISSS